MNTPGSMALGWGLLLVAGGGGLYFAKKDINERRREQARKGIRPTDTREWHERVADQQRISANQKDKDNIQESVTNCASPSSVDQGGLSSTFSKFDRPYREPNSDSKTTPNQ